MAKSTGAYVSDGIEAVSAHGPFALGFFLGALISYFYGRLASGEIKARMKIDLEREQELREQNKLKDDRIEKLHGQIEKLVNKKKGK